MTVRETDLTLSVAGRGEVSAVCLRPAGMSHFLVLGHGAGAGMRHAFLEALAEALAARGVGTLRYQFPYRERGLARPDPAQVLQATVRAAVNTAGLLCEGTPLFAGGKSMGGRMTSLAHAAQALHGLRGLVFYGFPLHPIGEPGTARAEHLSRIAEPMLFFQGVKDRLALPELMTPVLARLGDRATVEWIDDADHDFRLPKRAGVDRPALIQVMAGKTLAWMDQPTNQPTD